MIQKYPFLWWACLAAEVRLIEQIISSHPAAVAAGELEEVGRLATKIIPRRLKSEKAFPFFIEDVDQTILRETAQQYLDHLQHHDSVAPHWNESVRVVDKMWHNFFHLGFLYTLFPKARVIHSRRDAMDIGLSCFMRRLYAVHWSWDLGDIGYFYRLYDQLMQHWRNVLPNSIYEVDYEKLAQHPEEETRKLVDYCNLPWDDRCLEFYEKHHDRSYGEQNPGPRTDLSVVHRQVEKTMRRNLRL